MSYLDENGLARYDGLIKNWVTFKSGTVDGIDPLLNWQKTETAGSVTFFPLPAAPIDPVVNFMFTETGPASGDKAPDNPSTITGVTQAKVTKCGKNLAHSLPSGSYTSNGITFTVNQDGSVLANGTASADASLVFFRASDNKDIYLHGNSCVISGCPAGGSASTYFIQADIRTKNGTSIISSPKDTGSTVTYSNASERRITYFGIKVLSGCSVSNLLFYPQIEFGTTATAFEPYSGADYTVNLGGTYYGGSLDLSTGVMTVTKRAFRIGDYQDTITYNSENNRWQVIVRPRAEYTVNPVCSNSIFDQSTLWTTATEGVFRWATGGAGTWWWFRSEARTLEDFLSIYGNSYIVYTLYEPQTVSLTPTQIYSLSQLDPYTPRLNTVYSDQVSVQVGYPKSPLATSTELTNAIVSLGGNI